VAGVVTILRLELHASREPALRLRCVFRAQPTGDARIIGRIDVAAAVAADAGSFLHPPDAAGCRIIHGELLTGLLAGGRGGERGWLVELAELGAVCGESRDVAALPTIAFAVAAALAASHLAGRVDLRAGAHGRHGWKLVACVIEEAAGG